MECSSTGVLAKDGIAPEFRNTPASRLRSSYTVKNLTNRSQTDIKVSFRVPSTSHLENPREGMRGSHPFEVFSDSKGNQWVEVRVDRLAPYGKASLWLDFDVQENEGWARDGKVGQAGRGVSDASVEWVREHHPIERQAGETDRDISRRIFDYVRTHIRPTGKSRKFLGTRHAFIAKAGDCTEMATAVKDLAIVAGVPAVIVSGYQIKGSQKLDPTGYHNWVELMWQGQRVVVDPFDGIFEGTQGRYIPFYRGTPSLAKAGFLQFRTDRAEVEVSQDGL